MKPVSQLSGVAAGRAGTLAQLVVTRGGVRGTWCALPCPPDQLCVLVLLVSLLMPLICNPSSCSPAQEQRARMRCAVAERLFVCRHNCSLLVRSCGGTQSRAGVAQPDKKGTAS